MKTARVLRFAALALGALATMAVIGVFIWFWRGQMPSADARQLEAMYSGRKDPGESGNAFLDMYGLSAPVGVDPHARGTQRVEWLRKMHRDAKTAGDDPEKNDLDFNDLRSSASRRISEVCREGSARICADAVRTVTPQQPLNAQEKLLLARYEVLLGRTHWYEPLVFNASDPLPAYHVAMEAQRVALIRLRQAILRGDTAGVREALQRDLEFWRMVLRSTDGLIGKMIAVAAIRTHFTFANLALRELPPERARELIPDSWRQPLADEERSMWRVMAGEYQFVSSVVREMYDDGTAYTDDEFGNPVQRIFGALRRKFDPQRQLNARAKLYADVSREFAVPLLQYPQVQAALVAHSKEGDAPTISQYVLRTASIEGMRRATLLVFQLRSRSIPPGQVAAELKQSDLRAPFDGLPFEWSASEQAIVYQGPVEKRRALALLY